MNAREKFGLGCSVLGIGAIGAAILGVPLGWPVLPLCLVGLVCVPMGVALLTWT